MIIIFGNVQIPWSTSSKEGDSIQALIFGTKWSSGSMAWTELRNEGNMTLPLSSSMKIKIVFTFDKSYISFWILCRFNIQAVVI